MKKHTLLAVVAALIVVAVAAPVRADDQPAAPADGQKAKAHRDARREAYMKILTEDQKKIMADAKTAADAADTPEKKKEIYSAARKKVAEMMTDEQKAEIKKLHARRPQRGGEAFAKILTEEQKKILADARTAAAAADTPEKKKEIYSKARKQVEEMMTDAQKPAIKKLKLR